MPKPLPTASVSADPHINEVLQLIGDYQRAARAAVSALRQEIGTRDLLRAWRQGRIARSGTLADPKGRYTFHGAGCRFEIDRRTVDVGFGPMGRADGFDSWRLHKYADSAFEWNGISLKRIENALKQLASAGVITQPRWEPTPHLFYLSQDIQTR